jgi:hypothetical protein
MLVRATNPFYVSNDLICCGQILDLDPVIAHIYFTRGDVEYLLPETATLPGYETAIAGLRRRRKP